MQKPPNAMSVEQIIVFKSWLMFSFEIESVPFVISNKPLITEEVIASGMLKKDRHFVKG